MAKDNSLSICHELAQDAAHLAEVAGRVSRFATEVAANQRIALMEHEHSRIKDFNTELTPALKDVQLCIEELVAESKRQKKISEEE